LRFWDEMMMRWDEWWIVLFYFFLSFYHLITFHHLSHNLLPSHLHDNPPSSTIISSKNRSCPKNIPWFLQPSQTNLGKKNTKKHKIYDFSSISFFFFLFYLNSLKKNKPSLTHKISFLIFFSHHFFFLLFFFSKPISAREFIQDEV